MSGYTKVATFKERFSELAGESDKTITDLAKDLHVSYQTISAWRLGTRSPKEPTIIAIANHFGVDVAWLMGFNVPKLRSARAYESIDPLYARLSEQDKGFVKRMIEDLLQRGV